MHVYGEIIGKLSAGATLSGKLSGAGAIEGGLTVPLYVYPTEYAGPYEVTPTESEQTLATDGLMMGDDITIGAIETETKSATPTESAQTVTHTAGKYMTEVTVGAIPSNYVGTGITRRDGTDLSASGDTVSVPSGYYASNASKAVSAGTAGTPTATKGTVSNHSVSVTPSVTNTTGYITGGTKTGTAVTVSASELVSGNKNITESGETDVTNYETVTVPVADAGAASGSAAYITENGQRKWRFSYEAYAEEAGWVDEGAFGTTHQYKYSAGPKNTAITPSTSAQTVGGANWMMEGAVTVNAMPNASWGASSDSITKEDSLYQYTKSWPYYSPGYVDEMEPVWIQLDLEDKTVTPTTSSQTVTPTDDYCYLNSVTVNAMPSGTAGTPTATKSAVSNHAVTVTPSVTNTAGYITGGTKTGTGVSVSASELVSGAKSITSNGNNQDVTNYATVNVNVPSSAPTLQAITYIADGAGTETVEPDDGYDGLSQVEITVPAAQQWIDVNDEGFYTESNARKWKARPYAKINLSEGDAVGWVGEGITYGEYFVRDAVASGTTITPTTSSQTIGGFNYVMEGPVTVSAMPSGSATPAASITATGASVSTGTNTLTLSKSVSNTPTVSAGYVSAGTAGNSSVSLTASVTTKAAATIYPGTTDQTIASGTYLTGTQTVKALTQTNLSAENIKSGTTISVNNGQSNVWSVTGTYSGGGGASNIVTGTFKYSTTTAAAQTVTLSYSGSGYPIACIIVLDDGVLNSTYTNTVARYAIAQYFMTKTYADQTPTYTTSGDANMGAVATVYKSSTSTAATLTRTNSASVNTFSSSNATGSTTTCVRFKNKTSMSIYSGANSGTSRYGFFSGQTYRYWVIYSS